MCQTAPSRQSTVRPHPFTCARLEELPFGLLPTDHKQPINPLNMYVSLPQARDDRHLDLALCLSLPRLHLKLLQGSDRERAKGVIGCKKGEKQNYSRELTKVFRMFMLLNRIFAYNVFG